MTLQKYTISKLIIELKEYQDKFGDILVVGNQNTDALFPRLFSLNVFEIEDNVNQDMLILTLEK